MFPRTKNRKAISTVLTTLIILVASVVLGTGVVLYGTSLFQTSSQSQSIQTTGIHVWADKGGSGWAWGAADVRNDGDKLLSVNQISIRGTSIPFTNWYVDSSPTTNQFQAVLNYTTISNTNTGVMANTTSTGTIGLATGAGCPAGTGSMSVELGSLSSGGTVICLTQQTGPVSLQPGAKAIVYFQVPKNILTTVDAGSSGSVALYAGNVGAPQTVTIASQ